MAKVFRPSTREASILSKIESSKEYARRRALSGIRDSVDLLANGIAMKLVENELVETTSKNVIEEQIHDCLENLSHADDFDVDYQVAPFRQLVSNPPRRQPLSHRLCHRKAHQPQGGGGRLRQRRRDLPLHQQASRQIPALTHAVRISPPVDQSPAGRPGAVGRFRLWKPRPAL